MEVKVVEIKGKDSYLIKGGELNSHKRFLLNGVVINDLQIKNNLIINKEDSLEFIESTKVLSEYVKGDKTMTIEEFRAKPQRYCEDDSDEDVLRAIANKKELEGYEPVYSEPIPQEVTIKVCGYIEDTGSEFIECEITPRYKDEGVLYSVDISAIAMDEYKKLSEEYRSHAKFEKPGRHYLRFVKINNSYAFSDIKPFSDRVYRSSFLDLGLAKEEEKKTREQVRTVVQGRVFTESPTGYKVSQILGQLRSLKNMSTRKGMEELLEVIIKDISHYESKIN